MATSWLKIAHQTAIVTGAGSGIGEAVAFALAGHGCNVLLADVNDRNLSRVSTRCKDILSRLRTGDNRGWVRSATCDVTNAAQVADAVARADELAASHLAASEMSGGACGATKSSEQSEVPPPSVATILVNCAGITRDARLSKMTMGDWDEVLDVNLKGTFLACQAFCQPERLQMLLQPTGAVKGGMEALMVGGSIVNIGSVVSRYGNVGQVNYGASKGGVVGMTRSLAKEMAALSLSIAKNFDEETTSTKPSDTDRVEKSPLSELSASDSQSSSASATIIRSAPPPVLRVNAILPGFIDTPMVHAVPEHALRRAEEKIALRRLGRPEEVADLAAFLASSERSGYITGETIECSGMIRL